LDKTTLTLRIKGSVPNAGTMMLEGTHGTMLKPMLGNTWYDAQQGKDRNRRETMARMKTGFLILVATNNLQHLPAWLTLEKLHFVFDSCHPTWDSPKHL
jgi:hypothetical protein